MTMNAIQRGAERIDRAALASLHEAAPPGAREALGLRAEEIGGALVSMASRDGSTILNRALGLGVERPATRDDLSRILEAYRRRDVSRFYIHLHPEASPRALRDWLLAAGLVKGRGWMKFHRGPGPAPEVSSPLTVRPIGAEHARDFGAILAPAFDLSGGAAGLLASLQGRPGWHLYMSFAGEQPAGTGALFVQGEFAWLDWGSTHPEHRRKGGQGAVLAARISGAAALGCRHLLTETGEAVGGDPQHSYRNILRAGFQPAGLRENFIPAG